MSGLFNDLALRAAITAMDGLSKRQQAIGQNIANVDTPGYRAVTVNFENAVRQAMQQQGQLPLAATQSGHLASGVTSNAGGFQTVLRTGGSTRADQNNVDIDVELLDMSTTGIQYQALSQEVSKKLLLLKAIAQSR